MKLATILVLFTLSLSILCTSANAAQTDIVGPSGSGAFGTSVTVLPNGNIVVTDPGYDAPGPISNVGAVYLYDGATLALISTLTGSTAGDNVGSGITVLTNGNYVVLASSWDNPSPLIVDVGAVTWCSAITGCSGVVSATNSLIGSTVNDQVGNFGIAALTNGNYVVRSAGWDNPSTLVSNVGAVTWGNGTVGIVGVVSSSNSLIGDFLGDNIGSNAVTALTNGNYVVSSPNWDNPSPLTSNVGAVTWGNGTSGTVGLVSSSNSIVGGTANDNIGTGGITALKNGNYVVLSTSWDNPSPLITNVGAVTWGNGATGTVGTVSSSNSLVGAISNDSVGSATITPLANGNYVVGSSNWDNGAFVDAGAATWGNGTTGISGTVSSVNSLVGSSLTDRVGGVITALANGNYVVRSQMWNNGAVVDAGAATWGSGSTGIVGAISSANSLVGSTNSDQVGNNGIIALTNGNYVVRSDGWDNGAITQAGAVTWGNGTTGTTGIVSSSNSLVGSTASDIVGGSGVIALSNGNYVVCSGNWDNGTAANAGAVTWRSGSSSTSGAVSTANSMVGSTTNDNVGNGLVTALANGNYVIRSPNWDNGAISNVGAATWRNGTIGSNGTISSSNSLVGSASDNFVSAGGITSLTNGNYAVGSPGWDNGTQTDVGAVTWGNGTTGTTGAVSNANSLIGSTTSDNIGVLNASGLSNGNFLIESLFWDNGAIVNAGAWTFGNGSGASTGLITNAMTGGNSVLGAVSSEQTSTAYDPTRNRLFFGRRAHNIVSILSFSTTAIADGNIATAGNWSNGVPNGLVTGIIPSGRSMTISTKVNAGMIHVECGGSLSGGSASAYVVGSVRKDFCGATGGSFTYPIGDPSNYSPLNVTNANGTGNLTASVTDTFMPGLSATASSLSRYWSLNGSGITADLTFNYTNADVNGNEAGYLIFRRPVNDNALISRHFLSSVFTTTNTATAYNVSSFSDWSLSAQPLVAPTAANVSIEGRVTSGAFGIRNAVVSLVDQNGNRRTARTNAFGYYRFDDVEAGQAVILSVASKQYSFAEQVINVTDNIADVDFVALQ